MLSYRILRHLDLATKIARRCESGLTWHLGSVVAKKNNIISVGWNRNKTHPKSKSLYNFEHAEFNAIVGVDSAKLRGATLYISRAGYDFREKILLSKPCFYCQELIKKMLFRDVYYSIDDNHIGHWILRHDTVNTYEI